MLALLRFVPALGLRLSGVVSLGPWDELAVLNVDEALPPLAPDEALRAGGCGYL